MELKTMRRTGAAAIMAAVLAASLGAGMVGCSSSDSSSSNSNNATTEQASANSSDSIVDENGVAQLKVTLGEGNTVEVNATEVPAGPVTVTVENVNAPAISEVELLYNGRIIGEKENLAPGLDAVSFTNNLEGGDYQIYAPGAEPSEYIDLTVTGESSEAPSGSTNDKLTEGVEEYNDYVLLQGSQMAETVDALDAAVQSGDVDAAKAAYITARPYYERMESAVDGFLMPGSTDVEDNTQNLDYMIDMRESNLDEEAGWHGFHAIERDLWENGEITDETKALSTELATNTHILVDQVLPNFTEGLEPADLANGAADLLEEVSTTKITGEEEAYSHIDLLDFKANLEGAQQAFEALKPGLEEIDPDLVDQIEAEFQTANDTIDQYKDDSSECGYMIWTDENREAHADEFTNVITPLHDDVSQLAEKVATA